MKVPVFLADPVDQRPTTRAARASKTPTRESQIETRLVQRVKALGGEVRKLRWIGRAGAPDRIVMLLASGDPRDDNPDMGETIWVELKAPGRKASAAQHREHERMRKMGQRVEVVDSYERVDEVLK